MKRFLLLCLVCLGCSISSGADSPSLRFVWEPSLDAHMVKGHRLYYGPTSRGYTNSIYLDGGGFMTNFPAVTNYSLVPPYPRLYFTNAPFTTNATVFFAVTAIGTNNLESDFSNEAFVDPEFWLTSRPQPVGSVWMQP